MNTGRMLSFTHFRTPLIDTLSTLINQTGEDSINIICKLFTSASVSCLFALFLFLINYTKSVLLGNSISHVHIYEALTFINSLTLALFFSFAKQIHTSSDGTVFYCISTRGFNVYVIRVIKIGCE